MMRAGSVILAAIVVALAAACAAVQRFEDGSAVLALPCLTIIQPAYDSAGDTLRLEVSC